MGFYTWRLQRRPAKTLSIDRYMGLAEEFSWLVPDAFSSYVDMFVGATEDGARFVALRG